MRDVKLNVVKTIKYKQKEFSIGDIVEINYSHNLNHISDDLPREIITLKGKIVDIVEKSHLIKMDCSALYSSNIETVHLNCIVNISHLH